jgi:hypothetical protein
LLSSAAVLALVGPIVLPGCGTTGSAGVASVQDRIIFRSALSRWTAIKRAELQSSSALASTPGSVQRTALAFLITADWLEGEAAAQGVKVSASEVDANYRQLLNSPDGQAFESSLKRRGMSGADELFELRLVKLSLKLRAKIAGGYDRVSASQIAAYYRTHRGQFPRESLNAATPAIRQALLQAGGQARVSAFIAAYRDRWKQRTTCQPGYVIAECRDGPPLASPAQ